jgi:hypothetical protein
MYVSFVTRVAATANGARVWHLPERHGRARFGD